MEKRSENRRIQDGVSRILSQVAHAESIHSQDSTTNSNLPAPEYTNDETYYEKTPKLYDLNFQDILNVIENSYKEFEYGRCLFDETIDDDDNSRETEDDFEFSKYQAFAMDLLQFYLIFNIPEKPMQHLLNILAKRGIRDVPATVYQLKKLLTLKTQVFTSVSSTANSGFAYLSIANNLRFLCSSTSRVTSFMDVSNSLHIQLNIDGLPLFKSSILGLWTILMTIPGVVYPLPVAVYCGLGKPNVNEFLLNLRNKLVALNKEGFSICGKFYRLQSAAFICDTPARSYVMSVVGHTGYKGCMWCRQNGESVDGRMTFPETSFQLRTNAD